MKIAIIGGGAAGVITAHLLDRAHEVTLFEAQPILGGNVRTLQGNVPCPGLDPEIRLDAGVIEFAPDFFPLFHRLMERLEVPMRDVGVSSALLRRRGGEIAAFGKIQQKNGTLLERALGLARLLSAAPSLLRFRRRAGEASEEELYRRSLDSFLCADELSEWLRLLMVYAYSVPREEVGRMPAALTVPTLLRFTRGPRWSSIVGGSYRYIERILEELRGEVRVSAKVRSLRRDRRGVELIAEGWPAERFDKAVIATTPGQVLSLLADPSEAERRRFSAWRDQEVEILIHDDCGLYERRGVEAYSEFDVVEDPPGYNAYLNRLAGLSDRGPRHFHLSYGLASEVDPSRILHRQRHRTPLYTVEAFSTRREILATNGARHTYYAGAYLGDGLHEGACESADMVSTLLGGERIRARSEDRNQPRKRSPLSSW